MSQIDGNHKEIQKAAGTANRDVDVSVELMDVSRAILKQCVLLDIIEFNSAEMIERLAGVHSGLQIETGVDELRQKRFIVQSRAASRFVKGVFYRLTPDGKLRAGSLGKTLLTS